MTFEDLAEEQKFSFHVCASHLINQAFEKQHLILGAPGGTGKTTIIRILSGILTRNGFNHKILAFTGRACSQLSKSGIMASTCHSILYEPVVDAEGNLIRFDKRPLNAIKEACGQAIIVDEASTIPPDIHDILTSLELPILYVGDFAQLPPVVPRDSNLNGFNVMTSLGCTNTSLTKNFRNDSHIADLCEHLRNNNTIPRRSYDDLKMIPKSKALHKNFYQNHEFDIVICGQNKTRKKINDLIRISKGFESETAEIGEQVICLQNTMINNTKINNGELFTVEGKFEDKEVSNYYLRSLDDETKRVNVSVMNASWETEQGMRRYKGIPIVTMGFGYAISCHKSQGSQFDNVLFVDEDVSFFLDQQKFRYTACSRAMNRLTVAL